MYWARPLSRRGCVDVTDVTATAPLLRYRWRLVTKCALYTLVSHVIKFPIQLFIWPQTPSMSGRLWFGFLRVYKNLGRTETRTRDRICFQTIRSVRDISRDDRARIATCRLRTATDRFKANYSVDENKCYH